MLTTAAATGGLAAKRAIDKMKRTAIFLLIRSEGFIPRTEGPQNPLMRGSFRALELGVALFVRGMDPRKIHTLQNDDTLPFRAGRAIICANVFAGGSTESGRQDGIDAASSLNEYSFPYNILPGEDLSVCAEIYPVVFDKLKSNYPRAYFSPLRFAGTPSGCFCRIPAKALIVSIST
jgi:hypothetical protein